MNASLTPATKLEGTILVVPIVSTANLPQLAVDLLISSLDLKRIGILDSTFLIPVIGGREDGENGVTTPLELFGKPGVSLTFLQQRSPVISSRKEEFIDALIKFVQASQFEGVLFLTGLDLTNRPDSHMTTPAYYLLTETKKSASASPMSRITALLPPYLSPNSKVSLSAEGENRLKLPSSGLTTRLLRAFDKEPKSPPIATILQYVLEGDNREDAYLLATVVARVLGLEQFNWKEPNSWKQGLFGAPHDQSLFG